MKRDFPFFLMTSLMALFCIFSINKNAYAQSNWKENILHYINSLTKEDGGYGWIDQYDSHLTPTFAVVGILHDINRLPNELQRKKLIHFIRTHHPQFGDQVIQALLYKQKNDVTYLGV